MAFEAPEYLSPSSITTFEQCPLKFKYTRIDGLREPPTEATLMGNFVHDVFEGIYLSPPDDRTTARAREFARELWDDKYKDQVAQVVAADKLNDFRWKSWFCIENLWKLESPDGKEFDGVEFELKAEIDGVRVRGFVDRFHFENDSEIVVGDYKTGKVPQERYVHDKFFQLITYGAMFESLGIGTIKTVELIFVKGPKTFSKEVSRDDVQSTIDRIKSVYDGIQKRCETENFETNKTRLCDWCYFKRKCPAWSK